MLTGTIVSLETWAQATSTSTLSVTSFENQVRVRDPEVEYPDVESLFDPSSTVPPSFARSLVDVAIDIQPSAITIDFDNVTHRQYAYGYQNTYVFTFDARAEPLLANARIDSKVTTLGLDPEDVYVEGNRLFVNVEGLSFDTSTFVRINLKSEDTGSGGADRLFGGAKGDVLKGKSGGDLLFGNGGEDYLRGDRGKDVLKGGKGDDTLEGGKGRDTLVGGRGEDEFVFGRGDGQDRIRDFKSGSDTIVIGKGAADFDQLHFEKSGSDTVLTFANVTVVIEDVLPRAIDEADFLFSA